MAHRPILSRMIFAASLLTAHPEIPKTLAAIRTDRLSPQQIRMWNSIREIVFAKDGANRLQHPRLQQMWQSAEGSGHQIFVELGRHAKDAPSKAGEMVLEKVDHSGGQHIVSIRLFLTTINRAPAAKKRSRGAEQFVPFAGLSRTARYAEVLGHELAHVERVLADPNYLRLYVDLDRELNSYCSSRSIRKGRDLDQEEQELLERIDFLVDEVEQPVMAAEAEVWRELALSEGGRMGVHATGLVASIR
jgi:hypothetical protein